MANLNLSEFTEKLFVADADHTFIWDTAASISKRVSRNSWLNSGTLTSDAPVTISQTWNNVAVAFTGLKVNAAGTSAANSAAGSNLLDLQMGGVSTFRIDKTAHIYVVNPSARLDINISGSPVAAFFAGGLLRTYGSLGFSDTTTFPNDLILTRDGAGQLALRNGAAAQAFNVYGTYTSGTSYERLTLSAPSAANAIIGTNKGSGGGTARGLEFQTDGVTRMTLGTTEITTTLPFTSSGLGKFVGVQLGTSGSSRLVSPGYGIATFLDSDGTGNFTKLNLAGNTDSFPALKRSTTRIQAVLATTDTTFTNIQGKLTTDTAYTGTVVAATGYITIYDSTGTAYRVPCAV